MHTHFGSATHLISTFLGVLVIGTFWRLAWMRAAMALPTNIHMQGLARAALLQF